VVIGFGGPVYLLTQLPYLGPVLALGTGHIALGALIFLDESRLRPVFHEMLPTVEAAESPEIVFPVDSTGKIPKTVPHEFEELMTEEEWAALVVLLDEIGGDVIKKALVLGVVSLGASAWAGLYDHWRDCNRKLQASKEKAVFEHVTLMRVEAPPKTGPLRGSQGVLYFAQKGTAKKPGFVLKDL
jgi:hypothetical protein